MYYVLGNLPSTSHILTDSASIMAIVLTSQWGNWEWFCSSPKVSQGESRTGFSPLHFGAESVSCCPAHTHWALSTCGALSSRGGPPVDHPREAGSSLGSAASYLRLLEARWFSEFRVFTFLEGRAIHILNVTPPPISPVRSGATLHNQYGYLHLEGWIDWKQAPVSGGQGLSLMELRKSFRFFEVFEFGNCG